MSRPIPNRVQLRPDAFVSQAPAQPPQEEDEDVRDVEAEPAEKKAAPKAVSVVPVANVAFQRQFATLMNQQRRGGIGNE